MNHTDFRKKIRIHFIAFLLIHNICNCIAQNNDSIYILKRTTAPIGAINFPQYLIVYASAEDLREERSVSYFRELSPGTFVVRMNAIPQSKRIEVRGFANTRWKLSQGFNRLDRGLFKVAVSDVKDFREFVITKNIVILEQDTSANIVHLLCGDDKCIQALIDSPLVTFIDNAPTDISEETLSSKVDLSVNGISLFHKLFPEIDGRGLTSALKERSIDESDIDLKNRIVSSSLEDDDQSVHANQMATIIAGAGNTAPSSRGVALGSLITSTSFDRILPDPISVLKDVGVVVQNHSYGTIIQNEYGIEARAYDVQMHQATDLIHVFSAGNRGSEASGGGQYTGINGAATLSGNWKMAKNAIVVGSHDLDLQPDPRNSRGPAYDGRIKPEVSAIGFEGTSDAAAICTGTILLLQQAYMTKYGQLPESALMKAMLVATATDIGATGPDYQTGFGAIDIMRSMNVIQERKFFLERITTSDLKQLKIIIPSDVKQLRVALAWNDPAAPAGALSALVNDLDLAVVESKSNTRYLPWTLSSFPHIDSLAKQAIRKRDTLNNVELVTITNAAAGVYTIEVKAPVLTEDQDFYIVYDLELYDEFEWRYPISTEPVSTDSPMYLRWYSTFEKSGRLEASFDGGEFDKVSDLNLDRLFFEWRTPDHPSLVVFRMLIDSKYHYSDTLVVSPAPDLKIGFNCSENFMLQWDVVPTALEYKLYSLGHQYLEKVSSHSDTSIIMSRQNAPYHYAVSPSYKGFEGLRSLTYDYRNQGVNCYFKNLSALSNTEGGILKLELSTTYNVQKIVFERQANQSFVPIAEVFVDDDPDIQHQDILTDGGEYFYRAAIYLHTGEVVHSNVAGLFFATEKTFFVYPNPVTRDQENLHVISKGDDVVIELVDAVGKRIKSQSVYNVHFELSLSDINPGLYVYRILREGKIRSAGRLIIR